MNKTHVSADLVRDRFLLQSKAGDWVNRERVEINCDVTEIYSALKKVWLLLPRQTQCLPFLAIAWESHFPVFKT